MNIFLSDSSKDGIIMEVNYLYNKVRPEPDKKAWESFVNLQVVNTSYVNILVPKCCYFMCWKLKYSDGSSSLCVVWAGALSTKIQNGYRMKIILATSGLDFGVQPMQKWQKCKFWQTWRVQ